MVGSFTTNHREQSYLRDHVRILNTKGFPNLGFMSYFENFGDVPRGTYTRVAEKWGLFHVAHCTPKGVCENTIVSFKVAGLGCDHIRILNLRGLYKLLGRMSVYVILFLRYRTLI